MLTPAGGFPSATLCAKAITHLSSRKNIITHIDTTDTERIFSASNWAGRLRWVLLIILVQADKTGHALRLGLWAEKLQLAFAHGSVA
jgi:hypothetical protein